MRTRTRTRARNGGALSRSILLSVDDRMVGRAYLCKQEAQGEGDAHAERRHDRGLARHLEHAARRRKGGREGGMKEIS